MAIRPYLHFTPTIGERVFIDPQSCIIGQTTIGEDSSIWPMVVARGDIAPIHIGRGTNVQDGSILHVTAHTRFNDGNIPLIIGDRVTIGHQAMLHACTIEAESLIGMGAVILDKAVIAKHVLVAAGSVVPPGKKLVSGYLYRGNPVQQARKLTDQEIEYFAFSSEHYITMKDHYLQMGDGDTT